MASGWEGFQAPCPTPRKGVVEWAHLAQPCLPQSTQPLGRLCQWFPVFFFFFLAKIFCKGPGNWRGEGAGGNVPISSKTGGVNLL